MAVTGLYYLLEVKNAEKNVNVEDPQTIFVRIYDRTLEDATTTDHLVVPIVGSGDPFRLATVDNSEDKFTAIKPLQLTIKFISSREVDLSSFVNADIPPDGVDVGDPRWYVEAYLNSYAPENFIFKGFLNLDDCYEPFLPEKNEVVLIANDGLGGLKNIPLSTFAKATPRNWNRIGDYLSWALSKTGLALNLKAIFNIREATTGDQHFFDAVSLHAKTFEDKIGTAINCYDVIEKILNETAFLTQRNGEWWIVRQDEISDDGGPYYIALFDSNGVFQSLDPAGNIFNKTIFKDSRMFFSQEATTVHPLRPYKSIKEIFNFEYPQEIIDNIDYSRGTFISPLDPNNLATFETHANVGAFPAEGNGNVNYKATDTGFFYKWNGDLYVQIYFVPFTFDDWTLVNTGRAVTSEAYIIKRYLDINNTYEDERYIRITPASSSASPWDHVRSNPIPVSQKDKATVSVDFRYENLDTTNAATGRFIFTFYIKTPAGYWFYNQTGNYWQGPLSITNANFGVLHNWDSTNFDERGWQTVSVDLPPFPADGDLFVGLFNGKNFDTTDRILNYSNLQFTYTPYINGDYSKYSSFYYKVSKAENQVAEREKDVYISDAPKKLFKGALAKIGSWSTFLSSQALFAVTTFGPDVRIVTVVGTGDVRSSFPVGSRFQITGTVSNNGIYTVASVNFNAGNTIIQTVETLTAEGGFPTVAFQSPNFALTNTFFEWNEELTTTPAANKIHPYGWIQAFSVWNQFRNGIVKFQATVQGLDGAQVDDLGFIDHPHLVYRWLLTDAHEHTNGRIFQLLSFDMNFYNCEWTGTLVEVLNSLTGKHFDDNLETKYV